jgi:hypothetical protein
MELLTLSLFGAFFLALIDYKFVLGLSKALVAVCLTSIGEVILWSGTVNQKLITAIAAAFLSIVLVELSQRLVDY